ncbi:hypothetical protein ACHAWF_017866 [Thalassiosira exigua]
MNTPKIPIVFAAARAMSSCFLVAPSFRRANL